MQDLALPATGASLTAYGLTQLLQGAGFAVGGISAGTIGFAASITVAAAYTWNKIATHKAILTLGKVQQSLQEAIASTETNDIINFWVTKNWLRPDRVIITVHDVDPDGLRIHGGKYYGATESFGIDHTGDLLIELMVSYAMKNRSVDNPITYHRPGMFSTQTYDLSSGQWFRHSGNNRYSVNPCNVYSRVCGWANNILPQYRP